MFHVNSVEMLVATLNRSPILATKAARPVVAPYSRFPVTRGPSLRLQPCKVTNTGEEIYKQLGEPNPDLDDDFEVERELVYDAELGPLSRRVTRQYFDAITNDEVDIQETAFWFSEAPRDEEGNDTGWLPIVEKFDPPPECEVEDPDPYHPGDGRTPFEELEEGQEFVGEITDVWLYHGAEVDFGAEFDGIIPIFEEDWLEGANEVLEPGTMVRVKIHKLRMPNLFRWPVQLEILEPAIQDRLPPPDEYDAPVNLGWAFDQGLTFEQICELTGREYEPMHYYMPPDDDAWAKTATAFLGRGDPMFEPQLTPQQRLAMEPGYADRVMAAAEEVGESMAGY